MLKRVAGKTGPRILLAWNRGLGDIALGLFPIVHQIKKIIPSAEITFLTRSNLIDGFSMLEGVKTIEAPDWKRGEEYDVKSHINEADFDLIIEKPDPTYWMEKERGKVVPKLRWNQAYDKLHEKFDLPTGKTYVAIQPVAETTYGLWRNLPNGTWAELFALTSSLTDVTFLLLGFHKEPVFTQANVIDLRGKTSLFELLSILKNRCYGAILPDSGILSFLYYLDAPFPIKLISLWADPNHGILKQGVLSPNPKMDHIPLIGELKNLGSVSARTILNALFPLKSPLSLPHVPKSILKQKRGAILLAGGDGTRLGIDGPKGTFPIFNQSLFQRILEKAPKTDFPIAIMTSPQNHKATAEFLEKHSFFHREVSIFIQPTLPILNQKRNPTQFSAPNGNGSVFKAFYESPIFQIFQGQKIELIAIIPIDNVLANPNDLELFNAIEATGSDVMLQCIKKKEGMPPMGSLVERTTPHSVRLEILEYTDVTDETDSPYKYTGSMAIRFSFLEEINHQPMPPHFVWKQIKGQSIWGWKQELFLFDILPYAKKVGAIIVDPQTSYAPLKTKDHLPEIEKCLVYLQR